jgi:hypothetical protein
MWGIPIAQAWAQCCHYVAVLIKRNHNTDIVANTAAVRQAEAKVEMLNARR